LALPLVKCPRGGGECCINLYFNRRLCSYPAEAHLDILLRLYGKLDRERLARRTEHELIDELHEAMKGTRT
jgi:hypothetical protein